MAGQEASSTMQIEERQAPTAATAVMAIWWPVKCFPIPVMYGRCFRVWGGTVAGTI